MRRRFNSAMARLERTRFHRIALVGAWIFMLVSALQLGNALVVKLGNPGGVEMLFGHGAWGLTYAGVIGLVQLLLQTIVVLGAVVCTLPPLQRDARLRRAGHGVLTVWSAWLMLNLMWQFGADSHLWPLLQAALYTALFGCTGYRALCRWSGRPAAIEPAPLVELPVEEAAWHVEDDAALQAEHVSGSARVSEVTCEPADDPAAADTGARASARRVASRLWQIAIIKLTMLKSAFRALRSGQGPHTGSATPAPE